MNNAAPVELPDKPSFKPAEVCEIVQIPAYVLRTWENEFKDLGVAKSGGGARTYRRRDVELALRIKELVFSEHLTLAGVRRRLEQEHLLEPPVQEVLPDPDATEAATISAPVKSALQQVKTELRALLAQLTPGGAPSSGTDATVSQAARGETAHRSATTEERPSLLEFEAPAEVHAAISESTATVASAGKSERRPRRKK